MPIARTFVCFVTLDPVIVIMFYDRRRSTRVDPPILMTDVEDPHEWMTPV